MQTLNKRPAPPLTYLSIGQVGLIAIMTTFTLVSPAFAQKTFANHKQDCLARIQKKGISKLIAEEVCTCTMNKFEEEYTIQEFNTLINKSKTDKVTARQLAAVGENCLYE